MFSVLVPAAACAPPDGDSPPIRAPVDGWDEAAWRTHVLSHLPVVEAQLPALRQAVQDPRSRHGEISQIHEDLLQAEGTVPHLPWGAPLEVGMIGQRYVSAVTELRWSAELLLWALRPETTDELWLTYQRDAQYHLRNGEQLLQTVRAMLDGGSDMEAETDPNSEIIAEDPGSNTEI